MSPSLLWATGTAQSCRIASSQGAAGIAASSSARPGSVDMNVLLIAPPQGRQVRDELVKLGVVELHRGHEGAGLERARVFHPRAKVVRRVPHGTGAECRPAHQMGQVRAEYAVTRRAAHGVAVDAGQ